MWFFYLQILYQPKFLLCSYRLRHQEARMAPKRHLALNNTCTLLSSLPAFTEQELSSQLLQVITSTAVPWLSVQQTWQKPVPWSQIFTAVCAYSTDAHTGSPEPSLSLCNALLHHMLKPQKMSPVRHLPSWRKMSMRFHKKKKGLSLNQLNYPEQLHSRISKIKINNLVSAQFRLLVIYKKKHNHTLIFFRPGWA